MSLKGWDQEECSECGCYNCAEYICNECYEETIIGIIESLPKKNKGLLVKAISEILKEQNNSTIKKILDKYKIV
jgi:hypothetical protein